MWRENVMLSLWVTHSITAFHILVAFSENFGRIPTATTQLGVLFLKAYMTLSISRYGRSYTANPFFLDTDRGANTTPHHNFKICQRWGKNISLANLDIYNVRKKDNQPK